MQSTSPRLDQLEDLRQFVIENLCKCNHLEIGAFPVTERILVRSGKPCGIFFCLHGPRSVKFTAIWETERNTILFYSSTGERIHRATLVHAPRLESAAA